MQLRVPAMMQSGRKAILQLSQKKAKSSDRVGLTLIDNTLAIAHVDYRNGEPVLIKCEALSLKSEKDAAQTLATLVEDWQLQDKQCSFVLNRKDYHLHLVEAPEVEPDEMRAAMRWKVKDLLDMKVEEAAIDVFEVPDDAYRGRKMVYVVAARIARIQSIANLVNDSGMQLAVIDIPELVMHNLTRRFIDDEHGVVFIDLRRNGSTMNISHHGDLYLTRRINTQLEPNAMQSTDWAALKDRLVLEIQRSLDYYQSQMAQSPINRIVISQRELDTADMVAALNEALNAEVVALDLSEHFERETELTPATQQACMAALGATLRGATPKAATELATQEAA
jgi:MSHA biogenesis protein MshI